MPTSTTDQQQILDATENFVKQALEGDSSGHDWWHIWRVRNLALHLAQKEGADAYVVQLAALLHDVADWKFTGDEHSAPHAARQWLESQGVSPDVVSHVSQIIERISFKGAGTAAPPMETIEGQVVQDADRLDSLGAIGVARTFAYGGSRGTPMHDVDIAPMMHQNFSEYKNHRGTTINHFYEKLLLLKDRMNTKTARQIAEKRHRFLEEFLNQFLTEWDLSIPSQ